MDQEFIVIIPINVCIRNGSREEMITMEKTNIGIPVIASDAAEAAQRVANVFSYLCSATKLPPSIKG